MSVHDLPEKFLDREQLAGTLRKSVSWVDRKVAAGEIRSHKWGRRTRRFRLSEVLDDLAVIERKEAA